MLEALTLGVLIGLVVAILIRKAPRAGTRMHSTCVSCGEPITERQTAITLSSGRRTRQLLWTDPAGRTHCPQRQGQYAFEVWHMPQELHDMVEGRRP